jgi:hypothetical protein
MEVLASIRSQRNRIGQNKEMTSMVSIRSIGQMRVAAGCLAYQVAVVFRGRSSSWQDEETDERTPT